MKKPPKNFQDLPPIRVRREPPTVTEAVAAARDLADDLEQQVELAAGLIGMSLDEIRPHVLEAAKAPPPRPALRAVEQRIVGAVGPGRAPPRAVIVERRSRPAVVVERRGRPLEPRR